MLSAPATRVETAHPLKSPHTPFTPSPLSLSSTPDTVTNPDRAKPMDIQRVLSPLRARRTPVLVNAPDVRWRLAAPAHLRCVPSLDSVLSDGTMGNKSGSTDGDVSDVETTASETSESIVRPSQLIQRDAKLEAKSAGSYGSLQGSTSGGNHGSTVTDLPRVRTNEVDIAASACSPVSEETPALEDLEEYDVTGSSVEAGTGQLDERYVYVYRPHPLSPVLEVSSNSSAASSMWSDRIFESEPTEPNGEQTNNQQNIQNEYPHVRAETQSNQSADDAAAAETHNPYHHSNRIRRDSVTADTDTIDLAPRPLDNNTDSKPRAVHRALTRFKKGVKRFSNRVAETVVRRLVVRTLMRAL